VNKKWTCHAVLLMACFAATAVFAQEDFSAKAVNLQAGKDPTNQAKIYVTKDKMRIESTQPNGRGGAAIVNFSTQTTDILMPDRKMYMEFPQGQGPGASSMKGMFHIGNADDACGDWRRITTAKPNSSCRRIGSDTVNGRSTVKYEATGDNGKSGNFWIDPKLHFPIKWQDSEHGGELQDIKEGSQPASLFEIPSDYQKFQMPPGMGNMQHPQR
jgi:hypothetical protein